MKLALGQLEILPGMPRKNLARALSCLDRALNEGADLLLLPEMALPGYLLGDLWDQNAFLKEVLDCQRELVLASKQLPIAFGGLQVDWDKRGEDGRPRKFNAYFLAKGGELQPTLSGRYHGLKTLMPNYREFDDSRYFFDTRKLAQEENHAIGDLVEPYRLKVGERRVNLGITLCEDAWDHDYTLSPVMMLAEKSAEVILNLSASPFTKGKESKRNRLFTKASQKSGVPIAYCNAVGLQNNGKTVYSFDGGSCVYYPTGERSASLDPFESGVKVMDTGVKYDLAGSQLSDGQYLKRALEYGTKNFMEQVGCSRVVIGVSGGIDSALAATVYSKLLPKDQLLLVNMPGQFNSDLTRHASKQLADNLDCLYTVVGIQESVDHSIAQFKDMKVQRGSKVVEASLTCSDFVCENIQARDRSSRILAGVASCFGGVFTCNANKSETTVGYSTLYGDHAGFFANLADLWKGQVYELARLYNQLEGRELIPQQTIDMVPAAELNSAQDPSRGQGDPFCYPYHDALFSKWVEDWERKTPEEVLQWYAEGTLAEHLKLDVAVLEKLFPTASEFVSDMERWWKCYCGLGVAKRIQAPPILAFSRRAFGFDHREAQLGILYTKEYLNLKQRLLNA